MKSRILIITAAAALIASPANAAWTDTQPAVAVASAWTEVKLKVNEWVSYYWTGQNSPAPVAAQPTAPTNREPAQTATPSAPATTQR